MPNSTGKTQKLPISPTARRVRVDVLLLLLAVFFGGLLWLRYARYETNIVQIYAEKEMLVPEAPHGASAKIVERGGALRFLMFNVQNYFVDNEAIRSHGTLTIKSEESREAVADVIAAVKPEIVGLIEMGGSRALQDLQLRLEKRGLRYPYARALTREGEARALAILSQHSIVFDASQKDVALTGNRMMMRGLLDVSIQVDDGRIFRIMGVHLKSRYGEDSTTTEDLRRREAFAVAKHIHSLQQEMPSVPLLVYGDWNDSPTDASIQVITKGISTGSALKRLRPRDSRGENWTFYFRAGYEYCLYDHLFVNKVLAARMNKSKFCGIVDIPTASKASDHRALWCDLR